MKYFIITLALLIDSTHIFGQTKSLTLDLGERNGNKSEVIKQTSKRLTIDTIYLKNSFPNRVYAVAVNVTPHILDPLDFIKDGGASASSQATCQSLLAKYTEVATLAEASEKDKSEKSLKAALVELDEEQKKSTCGDANLLKNIKDLKASTIRSFTLQVPIYMDEDQDVTITITGGDKVFTYEFKGDGSRRWFLNYGFVFTSKSLDPREYFLQSNGDSKFTVSKKNKLSLIDLRYTPSIFYNLYLNKNLQKNFNHSLTGGLGFNTSTPVVSIGYNLMFNQNIGISTGICFYNQRRLNGRYHEGQILTESLDDDQLYDSHFRPNIFFAVNFRLNEIPFKSTEKK